MPHGLYLCIDASIKDYKSIKYYKCVPFYCSFRCSSELLRAHFAAHPQYTAPVRSITLARAGCPPRPCPEGHPDNPPHPYPRGPVEEKKLPRPIRLLGGRSTRDAARRRLADSAGSSSPPSASSKACDDTAPERSSSCAIHRLTAPVGAQPAMLAEAPPRWLYAQGPHYSGGAALAEGVACATAAGPPGSPSLLMLILCSKKP